MLGSPGSSSSIGSCASICPWSWSACGEEPEARAAGVSETEAVGAGGGTVQPELWEKGGQEAWPASRGATRSLGRTHPERKEALMVTVALRTWRPGWHSRHLCLIRRDRDKQTCPLMSYCDERCDGNQGRSRLRRGPAQGRAGCARGAGVELRVELGPCDGSALRAHGDSTAGRLRGDAEHQSSTRRAEASDLQCDSLSRSLLESTPSPVVFCHNDCQEGKNCCLLREARCVCLLRKRPPACVTHAKCPRRGRTCVK